MRVLVVEDSEKLRRSVATALRRSGYAVDECADGNVAFWQASTIDYDVIVLDLMLPGMDGLTIIQRLHHGPWAGRAGGTPHILILTARDTVGDRVLGLRTGADDYLIKPFALDELLARVESLARRSTNNKNPQIRIRDIVLDTVAKTVARGGQVIPLTPREYSLLEYLATRRGKVVSRTEIEMHIYDALAEPMSNVVDSAICALRRKLDAEDGNDSLIQTRRGMGYMMPVAEAPAATAVSALPAASIALRSDAQMGTM